MNLMLAILLFFLSGFSGYLLNAHRTSPLSIFLLLALPIAGAYFLGWRALIVWVIGVLAGGRLFWAQRVGD